MAQPGRGGDPDPPAADGRLRARAWAFLRDYVHEVLHDRVPGLAAETAFFVVLGLFPALLIAAGLLGVLDSVVGADLAVRAQERVVEALDLVLTDEATGLLTSVENLFTEARGQLLTVAAAGALVTLSGAFAVVINALNLADATVERRSWLRRRLLGLAMGAGTITVAALALAVLVVGPLLGRGPDLAQAWGLGGAFTFTWEVLRLPLLAVGVVAWTTTLFHVAPSRRTRWRDAVPGAVLTTSLWLVATAGFHLYLRVAAGGNPVLGAFGGGAIVMTWVYLLSLGLLLGGELNATVRHRRQLRHEREATSARPDSGTAGRPREGR